jgi:hypothetical protein
MPTLELDVTEHDIARRAHEISESDERGSDDENWHRAAQELRGGPNEGSHGSPGESAGGGDERVDSPPEES